VRRLVALLALAAAATVSAQNVQNVAKGFAVDKSYQMNTVDQISTFNGNLSVGLPIGPRFTVSSTLSYQFYLTYNGNVWDFETTSALIPVNPPGNQDEIFVEYGTIDARRNNAGMGWRLSLGGYFSEGVYHSADGAEHLFYTSLHGEPPSGASYTRDGTYLRLTLDPDNIHYRIEFPDGTYHLFENDGRLTSMHDRFGNSVTIDYVPGEESEQDWEIWDGSRLHKVDLMPLGTEQPESYGLYVVNEIDFDTQMPPLQAPRILFNYARVAGTETLVGISRQVATRQDCRKSAVALAPILESVTLVDGSKYEMTTDRGDATEQPDGSWTGTFSSASGTGASPNCLGNMSLSVNPTPSFSGHLLQLKHPTGARTAWTLQTYKFPPRIDISECTDITHCNFNATSQSALGVKERFDYDRTSSTTPQTKRTYEQAAGAALSTTATTTLKTYAQEPVTGAWAPVSQSVHYYTTPWQSADDKSLYGLPFTRVAAPDDALPPGETNPSGGRWLSSKLLDGAGNLLRYNYVSYESDAPNWPWENSLNRRMNSERVVQLSGGSIVNDVVTTSSNFDGVGHYRTTSTTTGTPPQGQEDILPVTTRTVTTLYNALDSQVGDTIHNTGTYPGSFTMWPTSLNWVLNTYSSQTTQETVNGTTRKSKALFQFAPDDGFLIRRRVLKNIATGVSEPALHANDLLSVFESAGGNVSLESHYGGDGQPIDDQQPLTSMPLPASPVAELAHTYDYGALMTSQYSGIPFLSANRTIDRSSGLPVVTTDPSGVETWLEYDTSGRLKWSLPVFKDNPVQYGPVTEYAFTAPSSALQASVTIRQRDGGKTAAVLTTASVDYDDFGRVWIEKRTMPDGTISTRETLYDALGQVHSVSEWGDLTKVTSYTYDSLGRVLTATAPDNSVTELTYVGGRTTTRKSRVASTTANDLGTLESTVETTDDLGRLVQVAEPGGTVTKYGYDVGGHLASVKMVDGAVIQDRTFTYDGRGLLQSEVHPESGTTNYKYDARGHMTERTPAGSSTVTFQYDAAERLYRVTQGATALKFFTFDRPNDDLAGDKSMGKMASALRHNYGTPYNDLRVTETFRYTEPGGRLSAKETTLSHTGETFIDSYKYDKLGGVTELTYPACATCSSDAPSSFKVTNTYTKGALTGVTGYTPAGGITYSPNGMLAAVRHLNANGTNGPLDTQTYDATTGMARPLAIAFTNFCPSGDLTASLTSKSVTASQSANLTVATTGTVTTYQWFELLSSGSSVVVNGQTGATLGVTMSVTKKFWARVGNGTCTVDSNAATVTVGSCTPPNATITVDTPMPINRNVTAQAHVPTSSDPNATYAWVVTGGTPVGGASTPTFTFKANCGVSAVTLSVTVNVGSCQSPPSTQNVTLNPVTGATLSVSGSSTIPWSSNATINVTLTGAGNWSGTWSGGGPSWTNNTSSFSRSVTPPGTTTYSTTVADSTLCPAATSNPVTITVTPPTPLLTATANSATQVQLTWSVPAGFTAESYDIERSTSGNAFTSVGSTTTATSWSGPATANTAYLYRVRAIKSGTPSAWSNSELATTVIFLDEPVISYSTTPYTHHIGQLRTAVNAVRTLAGLSAVTFTDASVYMLQPKTAHIQELRNALASARSGLGLTAISFTDPTLASGGDFKAVYINQLRGGVQ
jgi:YD repeat-containing protein